MLRTAMLICLAAFYHATAAPYAAVATTDDHNAGESPKIVFSLGEDAEDQDSDDGGLDLADALPEDEVDIDDLDFINRDIRNKNFLRFGRSAARPSRTAGNKDGNTVRFNRGEPDDNNFIRLGRSANFVRLGRRDSDNSVKTPSTRSSNSNFIRLGRGKVDSNFIRLGRGKTDFIRFGRDGRNGEEMEDVSEGNESLARLARGGNSGSNFIRLGKGGFPSSNFVRLGRPDNFLRFGKADNFIRFGRGGSGSNFIRLGKSDNFLRFGRGGSDSNFIRLGKADHFLRLGRSGPNLNDVRFREGKNNDGAHFGRGKLADRNFIRLGRSDPEAPRGEANSDNSMRTEGGNSWAQFIRHAPRTTRLGKREGLDNKFTRFGRDLENVEDNTQERHSSNNRSKRSIVSDEEASPEDEFESEEKAAMEDVPFRYSYPLSARIPNYVFAPELAVLPPLYSKRGPGGTGSGNFIRLG